MPRRQGVDKSIKAQLFPELAGSAFPIAPQETLFIGQRLENQEYCKYNQYMEPVFWLKRTHDSRPQGIEDLGEFSVGFNSSFRESASIMNVLAQEELMQDSDNGGDSNVN